MTQVDIFKVKNLHSILCDLNLPRFSTAFFTQLTTLSFDVEMSKNEYRSRNTKENVLGKTKKF